MLSKFNYMKFLFTVFLFCISTLVLKAQIQTYTIHGEIKNISSGKVYLMANSFEKKYYGKNSMMDSAYIQKGKFEIQREIFADKPCAYRFIIQTDSVAESTDLVFITPHNQVVIIDSINEHISPVIPGSDIQHEMKYKFNQFFKNFVSEANTLNKYAEGLYNKYGKDVPKEKLSEFDLMKKKLSFKSDSLFFQYSIKHPNSYVTLWKLIERFENLGYKNEYFTIYNLLINTVKNSYTGKLFLSRLNIARRLALNNPFPKLNLKDLSLKNIQLDTKDFGRKYTLVDFWFSHCAPCIREFPLYKKLYNDYKIQGFKIIGISVDMNSDIYSWRKIIKEKGLIWDQYLDEDSKLSKPLGINSFPTNFLLNEKGEIIQKNIIPEELENFLKVYLHAYKIYDKLQINEPE